MARPRQRQAHHAGPLTPPARNHYFTASGSMIDASCLDRLGTASTSRHSIAATTLRPCTTRGLARSGSIRRGTASRAAPSTLPTTTDVIQNYRLVQCHHLLVLFRVDRHADYEYYIGVIGLYYRPLGMLTWCLRLRGQHLVLGDPGSNLVQLQLSCGQLRRRAAHRPDAVLLERHVGQLSLLQLSAPDQHSGRMPHGAMGRHEREWSLLHQYRQLRL